MQSVEKPWFAFKVMAAGALAPQTGFNFAYKNGADFIIAGGYEAIAGAPRAEIMMKYENR